MCGRLKMQRMLGGLTVDGVWGPKTQKQYDKFVISTLRDKEAPTTSNDTNLLGYVEDLYQLSLGVGKSDRGNYVMRGYDPPAGIRSAEDVRAFQESNGLDVDGVWGRRRAPPVADKASRETSEESHARKRYTATRHGCFELWSTQKRYDLLQAQGAARQAGQYDLDEIERLLTDGMRNTAGAERTVDILSYSRDGELANTPVVLGRAAKGYTIPAGVYNVAATQQLLGVKADGMWGKETENLHDKLLVKYVHLLFDDLDYLAIYNHSTWKENVMQLMFMKDTNKIYYYQDIIYCEDAQPPVSTSSVFYNAEQIDNYWFYCEEDTDEDLF